MKKIKALIISIVILSLICVSSLTGCAGKAPIEENSGTENTSDTVINESTISTSETEPADTTVSTKAESVPDVVDDPFDEETTALANEIIDGLYDDFVIAANILNLNMTEPSSYSDGVDEYGNLIIDDSGWYIRMKADYNTKEKIDEAMHKVFSNEKCDDISSRYLSEDSTTFKMFDGELYCIMADKVYSAFKLPVESAVRISEDEILAKTIINYVGIDYPYEIILKNEDGVWKIDKLVDDGREVDC